MKLTKLTVSNILTIWVFGVLAWSFAEAMTMPNGQGFPNPEHTERMTGYKPNLYELTRQTAHNSRYIFMLLSSVVAVAFAIWLCGWLRDLRADGELTVASVMTSVGFVVVAVLYFYFRG